MKHLDTVVNMVALYKHDYRSGEISKKRSRRFISNTLMRGSILPVTIPPRATPGTSPALRPRGWEIV